MRGKQTLIEFESKVDRVIISWNAYERMCVFGERYASQKISEDKQREAYGILIGHIDSESKEVFVVDAVPVVAGSRTGVKFEEEQYVDVAKIDEALYSKHLFDSKGNPLFIIGWWHTHPGFGFFYSDVDVITHLGYQSVNPMAIGIVYDYAERNAYSSDPGIRVFTLHEDELGEISFASKEMEVSFEIEDLPTKSLELDRIILKKLSDLKAKQKILEQIDEKINKKEFTDLQKRCGLLLIQKDKSGDKFCDEVEDKKYLYTWNEDNLKSTFLIPPFRKYIESLFQYAKEKPDKRYDIKKKIDSLLTEAEKKINQVKSELENANKDLRPVFTILDSSERQIISQFEDKINTYIEILNALKDKSYNLILQTGWEPLETIKMLDVEKNLIIDNPVSLPELRAKFKKRRKLKEVKPKTNIKLEDEGWDLWNVKTQTENPSKNELIPQNNQMPQNNTPVVNTAVKKTTKSPKLSTNVESSKGKEKEKEEVKFEKIREDELFEDDIPQIKEDELFEEDIPQIKEDELFEEDLLKIKEDELFLD